MKKSQLKLFLKKIVTEARLFENVQDPTKDEMFNYLHQMYGNEEGFRDDAEVAIYWFANFYHGGQSSHLYSALSTSRFHPGPVAKGPEPQSSEEMMYEDLVLKFAPGTEEAIEIQKKHNSLNENEMGVDKNAERRAKNERIITKWMTELKDPRKVAVKMVDMMISRNLGGLTSADLADTTIFADGLDQIEDLLKDGKFEEALSNAVETAKEMIADEAGELQEGDEADAVNDMWAGSYDANEPFDKQMKKHNKVLHPNQKSKQKSKKFFSGTSKPKKTVQDFDWERIKKGIDKGTLKEEKKECQKCKGQGRYSHKFKSGNTQIVPCDNPGCHNGIVDTDEQHRITNGTHGKNCNCPAHDLKESPEQVIYKDRQGGQDVYWMDNRDSGGKIYVRPDAVAKMVRRGHRVVDLDPDPRMAKRQPDPDLTNYADLQEDTVKDEDADYVEYHSQRSGEKPFTLKTGNGQEKFEYVNAKYPSGKVDIGVYAFRGDVVYGYNTFKKMFNIK